MNDAIQEDLLAWTRRGDRARGGHAVEALASDWRPRVHGMLGAPSAEEVEDALQDALLTLCSATGPRPPRVLAPPEVARPAAWRARVLRNYLVDRHRRRRRREHAERAEREGWSPALERERWRLARGEAPDDHGPNDVPSWSDAELHDALDRRAAWRRLLRALPQLAIRRRVLIQLAIGLDVGPAIDELARTLHEDPADVAARVAVAERHLHDATHDFLSTAMVRVVYPDGPASTAREAARKAFARAIDDLRRLCAEATRRVA